ncbi:integrase DNA-binding domain-containing protein, partial [Clostridioides difficile]|nr:integrase DNA-binding domain-containing protein [Clostridioides difficile]
MSALKRRDSKNRILQRGESQKQDSRYTYKYVDALGKTRYVYVW